MGTGGKGLRRPIGTRMLELRKTDAERTAADVVQKAELHDGGVLLLPSGLVQILPSDSEKFRRGLQKHPECLVGYYTIDATEEDVAADVLAMSQAL